MVNLNLVDNWMMFNDSLVNFYSYYVLYSVLFFIIIDYAYTLFRIIVNISANNNW